MAEGSDSSGTRSGVVVLGSRAWISLDLSDLTSPRGYGRGYPRLPLDIPIGVWYGSPY